MDLQPEVSVTQNSAVIFGNELSHRVRKFMFPCQDAKRHTAKLVAHKTFLGFFVMPAHRISHGDSIPRNLMGDPIQMPSHGSII